MQRIMIIVATELRQNAADNHELLPTELVLAQGRDKASVDAKNTRTRQRWLRSCNPTVPVRLTENASTLMRKSAIPALG